MNLNSWEEGREKERGGRDEGGRDGRGGGEREGRNKASVRKGREWREGRWITLSRRYCHSCDNGVFYQRR